MLGRSPKIWELELIWNRFFIFKNQYFFTIPWQKRIDSRFPGVGFDPTLIMSSMVNEAIAAELSSISGESIIGSLSSRSLHDPSLLPKLFLQFAETLIWLRGGRILCLLLFGEIFSAGLMSSKIISLYTCIIGSFASLNKTGAG